jgi:PKD repeat protein
VFCNQSGKNQPANAPKVNTVIVQKNIFRDPRHGSNPWGPFQDHPQGALAVRFDACGTNHVIRYNDVFATSAQHYFKDGFGGGHQFGDRPDEPDQGGFPWADSDIYRNRIQHVYDDAISAEGDNRNVRIWENYIDKTFTVIANATVGVGPIYVWRNVSHLMGGMNQRPQCASTNNNCPPGTPPAAPDQELRGNFIKGGGETLGYSGGRAYYLHNTILQPPAAHCGATQFPCGAGRGIDNVEVHQFNIVSHNNLWQIHNPTDTTNWDFHAMKALDCNSEGSAANQTACRLSHDMYNGGEIEGATPEALPDWFDVTPVFAASNTDYPGTAAIPSSGNGWAGDFTLKAATTGHGQARALFNFNSQYTSPDVGAHQSGTAPMKFGRAAAPTGGGTCQQPPTASFTATPQSGSAPLQVAFDASASSAVSPATITAYSITYGDGSPNGTGVTQSHTYASAGGYTATLTVTDSDGCQSAPATQAISVSGPPTSATLQQGLNGYTGTIDAKIRAQAATTNYANAELSVSHEAQNHSSLIRFAIFQSEGGPVPNGATITAATLSLYKYGGPSAVIKASRLLKNWNEAQVTWNLAATGTSWTTAGANGSGSDYVATADGQGSVGDAATDGCNVFPNWPAACWLNIDVTSGVQAFAGGTPNYGWKLAFVSGPSQFGNKDFDPSEYTHQIARPKLVITWQ